MFKSTTLYYEESGKVPPIGPVLALAAGGIVAAILSFVYAYAINFIPFIYLNFMLTLGLGAAVGFSIANGAKFGKIRNQNAVIGLSVIGGLVTLYFAWAFTIYVWTESTLLVFNPLELWSFIQIIAEEGVWSIKGSTPTGAALYGVWGIEAAMIIGATAIIGLGAYPSIPYCESCDKWAEEKELTNRLGHPEDFEAFVKGLESKNFEVLTSLRNVPANTPVRLKVEIMDCSSCTKVHYLTITLIVAEANDDGKIEEKETILVENLNLDSKTHQELMAWKGKLNEKPPVKAAETVDNTETTDNSENTDTPTEGNDDTES